MQGELLVFALCSRTWTPGRLEQGTRCLIGPSVRPCVCVYSLKNRADVLNCTGLVFPCTFNVFSHDAATAKLIAAYEGKIDAQQATIAAQQKVVVIDEAVV
jgi:hypothetical protein